MKLSIVFLITACFAFLPLKSDDLFFNAKKKTMRVAHFTNFSGEEIRLEKYINPLVYFDRNALSAKPRAFNKFLYRSFNNLYYESCGKHQWALVNDKKNEEPIAKISRKDKIHTLTVSDILLVPDFDGKRFQVLSTLGIIESEGLIRGKSINFEKIPSGVYMLVIDKSVYKVIKY